MTSNIMNFDFNIVISCLSQKMIDKLEYACQTVIQELLVLKNDEEEKGNTKTYRWLNETYKIRGRVQPITRIIDEIFLHKSNILLSVISDYAVPEDVPMLRRFIDDYYIHVYKYTQENCDIKWTPRTNTYNPFNIELYSNMIFELGMYFYMNIHQNFVINQLYHTIDNNEQLK